MSLINEALKKAQRERAGHPAESASGQEVGTPARRMAPAPASHRPPPTPAGPSAGLLLGGVAVVLASVALGVVIWRSGPGSPGTPPVPVAALTPAPPTATATPAPPPVAPPPLATAPTAAPASPAEPFVAPEPPLFSEPPPLAAGLARTADTQAAPPDPATVAPPPAPAVTAPALPTWEPPPLVPVPTTADRSAAIKDWLEDITIQSVRFAGPDSRVLIRNRVYALGATVDRTLGLRLAEIHPNRIVFTDNDGTRFTKSY